MGSLPTATSLTPGLTNALHLIYRKEFNYRTRYNLISLLRDFELKLRDLCKAELHSYYYTFDGTSQQPHSPLNEVYYDEFEDFDNDEYSNEYFHENFSEDFANLKQTAFSNIEMNLTKNENLIIIYNVDYTTIIEQQQQQQQQQQSASTKTLPHTSSSNNFNSLLSSTTSTNTTRPLVYSKSGGQPTNASLMSTNKYAGIGDELLTLQLKRTYCYAIVDSKKKYIYFYMLTTENSNYDQIKQSFEQLCDIIVQRTNLINNTVLYKLGGLIGDTLLVEAKNIKQTATPCSIDKCFVKPKCVHWCWWQYLVAVTTIVIIS